MAENNYDRRYQLILDLDGDGTVDALTDGLLYMRYMFNLRGDALADGAVKPEATRTAQEIEEYLSDPRVQELLDLDQSGSMDALTDALMVLRYAFNLRNDALVQGAKADGSPFTDEELSDHVERVLNAAFVLDDEGNRTDELVLSAIADDKNIRDDDELDAIKDRYNYENLNTAIVPEPEPEPEPESDPEDPLGTFDTLTPAPDIISGAASPSTPPTPPSAPQELYVPRDLTFDELYKLATQNKVPARYAYLPVFENFDRTNLPQEFSDIYKNGGAAGKLIASDVSRLQAQGFFPEEVLPDADYDGFHDGVDKFPNDPTKWFDADNDGVDDFNDAFPNNKNESVDTDGDGTGDNADQLPDDARFTSTAGRNEFNAQDEVNRFVLQNSRKLVGAAALQDYTSSIPASHDFSKRGLKEFKAWRAGFARTHNRLPNSADINSWMRKQKNGGLRWRKEGRHGPALTQEAKDIYAYMDYENAAMASMEGRVSDRALKKDALVSWVQNDQPTGGTLWTGIFGDDVEVTPGAERLVEVLAIQDNKTNGTYTPHSSLSASDKKLLERYEQAVNTTYEAMESGTTPWDLEQLISAGASQRLADWFQGGAEIGTYSSASDMKKNATVEEKETFKSTLVEFYVGWLQYGHAIGSNDLVHQARATLDAVIQYNPDELLDFDYASSQWRITDKTTGYTFNTRGTNGWDDLMDRYEGDALIAKLTSFNAPSYIELPSALDMDLGGVNYDRDRLYMKMPGDDEVRLGQYNHTAVGPDDKPLYLNQSEIRDAFSTPIPHGDGSGAGYFVDVTDGEAKVGEYAMIWVELQEKPKWYERLIEKIGPLKAIFQIGAILVGRPDIAFRISAIEVGFKVLTGQTLHASDWASLAIVGLAKFGKITLPMGEAQAADAAKAAATAEGLTAGTQAYKAFVASQTAINVAGIGLGGMTAKQTMTLIRAAGEGDLRGAILPVLADFGDGWIKNGLGSLGVSDSVIDSITPGQVETINEVVSDMAEGASFEEAMTGQALDWLDDAVGGSDKLKQFFEGFEGDLQNILRVAEEFIVNEDIKAIGDHLLDSIKDMPLIDVVQQLEDNFEDGLKNFEDLLDQADIVSTFNKELIQPLEDTVNQFIAPLVAKAKLMDLELPESIQAQIDKVTADFNEYIGEQAYNLDDATEAAVKQGIIQAVLDNDGTYAGKAKIANAFTRELVIQQEIGKMDNQVVDALSPAVVAAGMRSVLNGVLLQNPNIGDNALKAMVSVARTSITNSLESGTFVTDFKTWMDGVTSRTEDTIQAKEELENVQAQGDALGQELLSAKAKRDALVKRRTDLEAKAEAPDANQADVEAYGALLMDDDYQAELVAATQDVIRISGEIKTLEATELTAVAGYEESKYELSIYNRVAPELQAYERDLFKDVVEDIDANFNAPEYANQQGIPLEEAYEHYISQGLLAGAPTTNAEANDRLDAAVARVYADVVESSGVDDKRLSSAERAAIMNDIRVKVLNDAPTVTGGSFDVLNFIESPEFAEYADTVNWDKQALDTLNTIHNRDMGSIAEFNDALLGRDYASFLSDPGNPLFYMKDMSTGEKDQYIKDLVDGNLFRTVNSSGEYEWVSGNAYLVLGEDGNFYQEKEGINGITLIETSLSDPVAFAEFIGSVPNKYAVGLANEFLIETSPYASMDRGEVVAGDYDVPTDHLEPDFYDDDSEYAVTDAEVPWAVRFARDWLKAREENIGEQQDIIDRLEAIPEGDRTFLQNRELENARNFLVDEQDSLLADITNFKAFAEWSNSINTAYQVNGVESQISEAKSKGEAARRRRAAELTGDTFLLENYTWWLGASTMDGLNPEQLADVNAVGAKVEADLMAEVDYSVLTDNDYAQKMNMVELAANGFLPEIYKEERDAMNLEIAQAEGAWEKSKVIFGSVANYPTAVLHEIVLPELYNFGTEIIVGGGIGKLTKAAAGKYADDVVSAVGDPSVNASILLDISEAAGGSMLQGYEGTKQLLLQREVDREAQGLDPLLTEQQIEEISYAAGEKAMVTSVMLMGVTSSQGFRLNNRILGDSAYEGLETLGSRVMDFGRVVGLDTAAEIVEEVGVTGVLENTYYGLGFTDRDVSGELGKAASMAVLATGPSATAGYGLSMITDLSMPTSGGASETNDPLAKAMITGNANLRIALEEGDPLTVKNMLLAYGVATMPVTYNAIMNVVDDTNYVTYLEAEQSYKYIGVDPSQEDIEIAVTLKDIDDGQTLDQQLVEYWTATFGEGALGTGRTTAQNYDIIKHLENMRDGAIPLDATFIDEQTGESTLTQDVIDDYIASLPQREQDFLADYDVANHVPTNIVEELGGSLMTQDQIDAVNKAIKDLQDAPDSPTAPEVLEVLLADESIGGIPAQVKNLVDAAFADAENQAAFAATVVQALIDDGSLKTLSETEVAAALGSSEVNKESGIYLALKELSADIASGDTDVTGLVTALTGKVNTLNNALIAQGSADSTARDAITSLIGSNVEGEETGVFKILKDLEGGQSTTDEAVAALDTAYQAADTAQDATIAALVTNVGTPAEEGKKATGLHLIIEEAIAAESSAREAILGEYVDFAAFESALGTATDNKINSLKTTFGVPGEYKTDEDGNIVYKDDGSPDWETVPTGYFLDAYNASQLEGEERENALTVLQGEISESIKDARSFGTDEAERVKTEIMDEYFPTPPPALGAIERDILAEANYMSFLMRNDQYDESRDETGDGMIGPLDIEEFLSSFDDDIKSAVYQHLVYQDNGTLAGEVRRATVDAGTTYAVLDSRITAVNDALTKTITDNVLDVIGTPERTENNTTYSATGLFKLIEDGDADIEKVIGKVGDKGFGILRSLEIAGLDIDAIQNFLDTNVGKPATDKENATGLFAVTGANADAIANLTTALAETAKDLTALDTKFTGLNEAQDKLLAGLREDLTTANANFAALQEANATDTELAAAQAEIDAAEEALTANTKSITANAELITGLREDLTAANANFAALQEANATDTELAAAQAEIDAAEEALAANTKSITANAELITGLREDLTTANANFAALQEANATDTELAAAQAEIDAAEEALTANTKSITANAELITGLREDLTAANANFAALQEANATDTELAAAQAEIDAAEEALAANTKSITANAELITGLREDLTAANANFAALQEANATDTELAAAQAEIDAAEEALAANTKSITANAELITGLREDLTAANANFAALQEANATDTELAAAQAEIDAAEEALAANTKSITANAELITGLREDLTAANANFAALQEANATDTELAAAQAEIDAAEEALTANTKSITANAELITGLREDLTAANANFAALQEANATDTELAAAQAEIDAAEEALTANTKSITANAELITGLREDLTAANANFAALQEANATDTELAAAQAEIDAAEEALAANTKSITANAELITGLREDLTTANANFAALQEANATDTELAAAQAEIDAAEEALTANTKSITANAELITGLREDLTAANANFAALQEANATDTELAAAQAEIDAAEEALTANTKSITANAELITGLREDLTAANANFAALQEANATDTELAAAQAEIDAAEEALAANTKSITANAELITGLREDLTTANANFAALQEANATDTELAAAQAEIDAAEEALTANTKSITANAELITGLREDLTAANANFAALQEANATDTELAAAQAEIDAAEEALTANTKSITANAELITGLREDLTAANANFAALQEANATDTELAAAQAEIDAAEEALAANTKSITANAELITGLREDLTTANANFAALQEANATDTELAAAQAEIDAAEEALTANTKSITANAELITGLREDLTAANANFAALQEANATDTELAAAQAEIDAAEEALTANTKSITANAELITGLREDLTAANANFAALQEANATDTELAAAQAEIDAAEEALAANTKSITANAELITGLREDLTTANANFAALQEANATDTELAAAQAEIDAAEEALTANTKSITANAELITGLREDLTAANANFAALQEANATDTELAAAQAEIDAAEEALTANTKSITANAELITGLREDLTAANANFAALQEANATDTELAAAQAEIDAAEEALTANTKSITANAELITGLREDLTTANANFAALQEANATDTELAAAQAEIDAAEEALTANTQAITDLQTDVETKADQADLDATNIALQGKASQADLNDAKAKLTTAQETLDDLIETGASNEDLQAAQADVDQAQTDILDIEARLEDVATTDDLEGLATTEDVEAVGEQVEAVAELFGRDANLLTQEDLTLANQYLDSVEQENELLYDVDNSGTFDQTDVNLVQAAVENEDYSGFVDSQFGPATGMFAEREADRQRIAQMEQDALEREAQYEVDLTEQRNLEQDRQVQLRQDINTDFQQQISAQEEEEEKEKFFKAMMEPGRRVTTKPGERAKIDNIYDFESIFRDEGQDNFYGSASPFGENFLEDIGNPQQRRAKGGMIKDTTDEILKIIGDK